MHFSLAILENGCDKTRLFVADSESKVALSGGILVQHQQLRAQLSVRDNGTVGLVRRSSRDSYVEHGTA